MLNGRHDEDGPSGAALWGGQERRQGFRETLLCCVKDGEKRLAAAFYEA
jgi:hypothetical protein